MRNLKKISLALITLSCLATTCLFGYIPVKQRDEYYKINKDDKWGLMHNDNVVIPIEYDSIKFFPYNLYAIVKKDGKWGLFYRDGKEIIPAILEYDDVEFRLGNYIKVKKDGKFGFINRNTEIVIPITLEYDDVDYFSGDYIRVKKNGKWGYAKKNGDIVLPIEYDKVDFFKSGFAKIEKNGKLGYINDKFKIVIPVKYDDMKTCSNKIAKVKKNGKYFYLEWDGKDIIDLDSKLQSLLSMEETIDSNITLKDGKFGFLNNNGDIVLPIEYDEIYDVKDEHCIIKKDGKFGYIDKNGKIIIPAILEYDDVDYFDNGVAKVIKDGKSMQINTKGEVVESKTSIDADTSASKN